MESSSRRDAQAVEITLAIVLGAAVAVLPMLAMWLAGRVWSLTGPGWTAVHGAVATCAPIAGASVAVLWLVGAYRRGL